MQIGYPSAVLAAVVACKNGVKRAHLIDADKDVRSFVVWGNCGNGFLYYSHSHVAKVYFKEKRKRREPCSVY